MDKLLELKNSFRDLTKYLIFLLVPLIAIGGYLIQRSYMAVLLSDSLESDFVDKTKGAQQQSQVSFSGLSFNYGSMNMFWPIIVLLLYVTCYCILIKQQSVLKEIKSTEGNSVQNLHFDSLNLFIELQINKLGRFVFNILLFIPLLGLLTHLLSGIFIFWRLSIDQVADQNSAEALIMQLYLQLVLSLFCFILSVTFPFKLIRYFKTLIKFPSI